MQHQNWSVQECFPLDFFDTCTLTVEQWLANTDEPNGRTAKWATLIHACSLVEKYIAVDGLRQEPRIGYDPGNDGTYFIFKVSNNGTTYLVAPQKVLLPKGVENE